MNMSKYLIFGLFVIAVIQADPAAAIICKSPVATLPTKPWHVTELKKEGVSLSGQGGWYYKISWKPALTKAGGTVVKTYKVSGYKCSGHKYACTDARCNAEISGCVWSSSIAFVTADFGVSVSGMRLGAIYKPEACLPPDCKPDSFNCGFGEIGIRG
jgi:hypothetical protein